MSRVLGPLGAVSAAWLLLFFAQSDLAAGAVAAPLIQAPQNVSVWDGVYSEDQATRGAVLYSGRCAACHGSALEGVESAPPLVGDQFDTTWSGTPLSDLGERIRSSMPADNPGSLNRDQLGEVLAYMLKAGKFPSGRTPLDAQAASLARIRYESIRPQLK